MDIVFKAQFWLNGNKQLKGLIRSRFNLLKASA